MGKKSTKYRVYHYYPDEKFLKNKYDSIDFADLNRAIAHLRKSRSASHIRVIRGGKVAEQINPRTGGAI